MLALKLVKGHPHLRMEGASIDVLELMPMGM